MMAIMIYGPKSLDAEMQRAKGDAAAEEVRRPGHAVCQCSAWVQAWALAAVDQPQQICPDCGTAVISVLLSEPSYSVPCTM